MIDISMPLSGGTPIWPQSPGVTLTLFKNIASGDLVNATLLELDVHCGTHIDAPLHFLASGATIEGVPLAKLNGSAWVVDCGDAKSVDREQLEEAGIPRGTRRLLLRTLNSRYGINQQRDFVQDYCAITPEAAKWIVERKIDLIGIDYLSIQRYQDPPDVHTTLLRAEVAILEGLLMAEAPAGPCELTCLPLLIPGAEAAPARAVIRVAS